jgi:transaldolase
MKIFIDSGETKDIKEAHDMGLIDGVTTNPTLASKSGKPFKELIMEITEIVDGPISAEVVSITAPEMIAEGEAIAAWHKNIVVKVPLIPEGLKAVKHFTSKGIKTNVTLCFTGAQALLAAKAGATYISPFVGRLDDICHSRHSHDLRQLRFRNTDSHGQRPLAYALPRGGEDRQRRDYRTLFRAQAIAEASADR